MPQTLSYCWCIFSLTSAAHSYMTRYHWVSRTSQLHTKASLYLLLGQLEAISWWNKLPVQNTSVLGRQRHDKDIFKHRNYSVNLQGEIHLRHFCSLADCGRISTGLHQCGIQPSSTGIRSIPLSLMHIPETEPASQLVLIIYSFLGRIATGPWNFSCSM